MSLQDFPSILSSEYFFKHLLFLIGMNLPNALTISRLLLAPFVYYAAFAWRPLLFAILFSIGIITDILDGFFARRWNQTSDLGSTLDTAADMVFYTATVVFGLMMPDLPFEFMLSIGAAALLIVAGIVGCWLQQRVSPHKNSARAAGAGVLGSIWVAALFGYQPVMFWITFVLVFLAGVEKVRAAIP